MTYEFIEFRPYWISFYRWVTKNGKIWAKESRFCINSSRNGFPTKFYIRNDGCDHIYWKFIFHSVCPQNMLRSLNPVLTRSAPHLMFYCCSHLCRRVIGWIMALTWPQCQACIHALYCAPTMAINFYIPLFAESFFVHLV